MGLLSDAPFLLTFDAASLARIARLIDAEAHFRTYYLLAMRACVAHVVAEAKDNATGFVNPTGNLLRNITGEVLSPYLGVAGVTRAVPYARRREFGFTGLTDSLGRTYTYDPGKYYLRDALEASRPFIQATYHAATQLAIREFIL